MKYAVIGTGRWGKNYLRLLDAVAVNQDNLEEAFTGNIEAVVIATPVDSHFALAKRAIESGKHVLLEKPMTANLKEAHELKKLVRGDKTFMVAHQYIYNDYIHYIVKSLAEGQIGALEAIEIEHRYMNERDAYWDASPHEFAILDFMFANGVLPKKIIMSFSNTEPKKVRRRFFAGESGSIFYDDSKNDFLMYDGAQVILPKSEPLENEVKHFLKCIKNKMRPMTDIEHGLRVMENMNANAKTHATHGKIELTLNV